MSQQATAPRRQNRRTLLSQAMQDDLLSHAEELKESQSSQFHNFVLNDDDMDLNEILEEEHEQGTLFDAIVNRLNGDEKMQTLTNFYPDEILEIYEVKRDLLQNESRGKRPKYNALDRFVITLAHCKHA